MPRVLTKKEAKTGHIYRLAHVKKAAYSIGDDMVKVQGTVVQVLGRGSTTLNGFQEVLLRAVHPVSAQETIDNWHWSDDMLETLQ